MSLELAILLVKTENEPDGLLVEFLRIFVLSVACYHWNVELLGPDHSQDFEDLVLHVFLLEKSTILGSSIAT